MKDDYYNFDEIHHQLKGQRGGKVFRLGDTITIQVASVNLDDRQMVFTLGYRTINDKPKNCLNSYFRIYSQR
jgi:DNA-directed RNA polymerase subunit E'/Rpb7